MTPNAGSAIITEVTIPATGSYSWDFGHSWDAYDLSVGAHNVVGILRRTPLAFSMPQAFQVVAPEPVVDDVFIDFETLPQGEPTSGIWRTAYASWGVELQSEGGGLGLVAEGGNKALYTPSGSHPFNVVANFDMPVFGVSADVGTAAERTVSMTAFDESGNLLGVVSSEPISNFPNLVGPLSFSSSIPIASVQWLSSQANASVRIDNLRLEVDGNVGGGPGDFNADAVVDGADFLAWQSQLGALMDPAGSGADGNSNGVVDAGDLAIWKHAMTADASGLAARVPEPISAVLAGCAAACGLHIARRTRA